MSRYNTDMRILLTLTICCLAMPLQAQPDARLRIIRGGLVNRPGEQFSITELSPTVYVDEATSEVRSQIARANQFLVDEHWSEAIGMLMRVAESPSSRLTSSRRNPSKLTSKSKSGYKSYVSIPEFVTQSLSVVAKRSPKTFATYRERISPLASQWLAEATEQRDEEQLKRIVRDYFHSEAGDEALLLLGDWALEAGRTDAAREYWSRLHWQLQWQNWPQQTPFANRLRRGEVVSSLVRDLIAAVDFDKKIPSRVEKAASDLTCYVQSDVPMADVWARFTLASIIEGDLDRARSELDVMRKTWPNATGTVGGKSGKFVKLVSSLLNQSRQWAPPNAVLDWSTFAGNTDRNKVSASVIDIPLEPSWRTPLATLPAGRPGNQNRGFPTQKIGERTDAPSRHFPIVVGDLVFVHDASRIRCLRLRDGKPAWSSSGDGTFFSNTRNDETGIKFSAFGEPTVRIGEPRFMLSATGDTLVATLGSYQGGSGTGNPGVIGFDLKTEGGVQFGPVEIDDGTWTFQGVPVCEGTRCWIGLRQRNTTSQDFVACFDMTTGEELWRTKICSADSIGQNSALELSNHLLTKHEDRIYYSSHLGTVAAVDASDGSIQWVTAYARQGLKRTNLLEQPWQGLRDLTPCLYHDGLLIVAPADSTQIFAFHAMTGKPIWQTDFGRDANQLLGVGDNGHLIVSGRRLWWIDVATGVLSRKVKVNPFPSSNVADPRGAGRGVLSGGSVYWPTIDDDEINKIYVLSQANGESQRQPIDLEQGNTKAGNLIVTPSHLLIAAPDELVGYAIQQTEAEEP